MQVLLLLKASDRVVHDICHATEACSGEAPQPLQFTLALRKWHTLRPGREFRCFVRGHNLVGRQLRPMSDETFSRQLVTLLEGASALFALLRS